MAQLYSTGPAHMFVAFPSTLGTVVPVASVGVAATQLSGAGPFYLGTCERAPRIIRRPGWKPVFNDIGGTEVPFDMSYQGEEAFTFGTFTRWNEPVLAALQARPNPRGVRGTNGPFDVGSLLITEGLAYTLLIYFPFVVKAAYAAGGMVPGWRFPASFLEGPDEEEEQGTSPKKDSLIFHHLRTWDPTSLTFVCYDTGVGIMPPIN